MAEIGTRQLLPVLLALALTACGGAQVAESAAERATAPTADASAGTAGDAAARTGDPVGEVTEVLNVESFVDNEPALSGDAIVRNARLSTNSTGLVRFVFTDVEAECVLIRSSAAVVVSHGRRLLRQVRGEAACEVDSPDRAVEFSNRGRIMRIRQGVFRLAAGDGGGGAEVVGGQAQAVDPNTGDVVDMDAGDSTGWDTSGALTDDSIPDDADDAVVRALTNLEDSEGADSGVEVDIQASTTGDGDGDDGTAGGTDDDAGATADGQVDEGPGASIDGEAGADGGEQGAEQDSTGQDGAGQDDTAQEQEEADGGGADQQPPGADEQAPADQDRAPSGTSPQGGGQEEGDAGV